MPAQKEFVRFMLGQLADGAIDLPQDVRRLTVSRDEREAFLADT